MSILESLHWYNTGQLVFVPDRKLNIALQVLENKISYMRDVAKQGSVASEVLSDIRTYEKVHAEIKKVMAEREVLEAETLCGMLKEAAGEGYIVADHNQFPRDYSII